jgi:hypothetical protein
LLAAAAASRNFKQKTGQQSYADGYKGCVFYIERHSFYVIIEFLALLWKTICLFLLPLLLVQPLSLPRHICFVTTHKPISCGKAANAE